MYLFLPAWQWRQSRLMAAAAHKGPGSHERRWRSSGGFLGQALEELSSPTAPFPQRPALKQLKSSSVLSTPLLQEA